MYICIYMSHTHIHTHKHTHTHTHTHTHNSLTLSYIHHATHIDTGRLTHPAPNTQHPTADIVTPDQYVIIIPDSTIRERDL